MNKLMVVASCAAVMTMNLLAGDEKPLSHEQLKDIANQPQVQEQLGDDGVFLGVAPDGSYIIFSRGTGEYLFSTPTAELKARKVARLNAEKQYAKFISTLVESSDGVEQTIKDSNVVDGDGKVQIQRASEEAIESIKSSISSRARAVISGLVTLESKKIPTPGGTGGVIQLTMVYSSKTANAAMEFGKAMQNHQAELKINDAKNAGRIQSAREASTKTSSDATATGETQVPSSAEAGAGTDTQGNRPVNKPEYRKNNTIY